MKTYSLLIIGILMCFAACKHESDCNDCLNGGKCVDNTCQCPPGYSGDRCQTKISCYGLDCQNGSTCKGDSCACLFTFYGKNCELSKVNGKTYIVKNVKDYGVLGYLRGTKNSSSLAINDYVHNGDLVTATTQLIGKTPRIWFEGKKTHYWFDAISHDQLYDYDNKIAFHDYMDFFHAKLYNNGDFIHVYITRYDDLNFYKRYDTLLKYDLVKQ